MEIKAIIFDLYKTLGDFRRLVTPDDVSSLLRNKGYEVYPQAWRHAFGFVLFIDYPRYGLSSHEEIIKQTLKHLNVEVDEETLIEVGSLFKNNPFIPYAESIDALKKSKELGLKTAISTSTPKPFFESGIQSLVKYLDFICTGYEAGYEKSNPQIYNKVIETLSIEPEETVVIGDNPILDIFNAKNLGFITIHLPRKRSPSKYADEIAKNVLEAVNIVEKWIQIK